MSHTPGPVRKLPVELLLLIFEFYQPEFGLKIEAHKRVESYILTLSHVCSHWRTVAVSQPSLWSTISIDFRQCTCSIAYRLQKLTNIYLRRSKRSLLNIDMKGLDMFYEWSDLCDMDSTFRRLLDQSSRWKIATIDLPFDSYYLPIKPTRSIQFPELEVVELACDGADYVAKDSGAYHFIHSLLDNSPKLHRIVLPQVDCLELSSITKRCNFDRLTSAVMGLDCRDYETEFVWAILVEAMKMLPGLQELSVNIVASPYLEDCYLEDNGFQIPKTTSCALKSLSLTLTPSALWVFTQPLIEFLNLNTLTTLEISLASQQDSVTSAHSLVPRLKMMFQNLSNTLQSFRLTCCDILSTEGLLSILSWMPFLQDLSLDADCRVLTSAFFSALTLSKEPETTPHLLPRLTALRLNYTNFHSRDVSARLPDPNTVFDMILSRRQRISGSTNVGGLCQFSLSASVRSCLLPDREWAAILRLRLRERELQQGGLSWTCVLDLGEL